MTQPIRRTPILLAAACLAALPALSAAASAAPVPATDNVWRQYIVQSPSTGKIERFWVGHPKALKPDGKYPAVYFLPGLLDDDDTWKKALDPHLAKHNVVAVCPAVGGATWFMNSPAQPWMRWGDFLTEDLRAFVEANYPVSSEKGQRGLCGISAGGHGAFYHAIRRPELYGSVSVLSGSMDLRVYAGAVGLDYWIGPRSPEALPLYAERSCLLLAEKHTGPLPFALYLDCADKDGARVLMEPFRKVLDSKGIAYRWNLGVGSHNWDYWNSRAGDHLAWHAAEFARNRSAAAGPAETTAPKAAPLEVLKQCPIPTLSEEAVKRLQAPWDAAPCLATVKLDGLPPDGAAPISQTDEKRKQATLGADLPVRGHAPGLHLYRLTLGASTPVPKEGTISLRGVLRNGRRAALVWVPLAELILPAGEANRRVEVRVRMAVEVKPPDPLRGGIVVGIQVFDAAGQPAGKPLVGQSRPGTTYAEEWVVAPSARAEWVFALTGPGALPVASIHAPRLEAEPAGQ